MEMDVKKVRELMTAMVRNGMVRLRLKVGDSEIELESSAGAPAIVPAAAPPPPPVAAPAPAAVETPPVAAAEAVAEGNFVVSPMVGTFYSSPSPEAEVFVKVGDTITEDTVVCIIEAMKVMNEVKAGKRGVVKELVVENGHPVEFGTNLFRVG